MNNNSKGKAVLGFLRSVAVGIGVQIGYTACDQIVRSYCNEFIKRRLAKTQQDSEKTEKKTN